MCTYVRESSPLETRQPHESEPNHTLPAATPQHGSGAVRSRALPTSRRARSATTVELRAAPAPLGLAFSFPLRYSLTAAWPTARKDPRSPPGTDRLELGGDTRGKWPGIFRGHQSTNGATAPRSFLDALLALPVSLPCLGPSWWWILRQERSCFFRSLRLHLWCGSPCRMRQRSASSTSPSSASPTKRSAAFWFVRHWSRRSSRRP